MIDSLQYSSLPDAFSSGLKAYQQGAALVQDGSANLSQSNHKTIDINRAAVNLIAGGIQADAAANVIKRADGMIGTIIDTFA
ncbi:hypothetical protein [Agaribacter flavus]|uniref:Uncharacterized protein n=1 Tax=Agaribacter flavus TaxID=1902781 RepID=A0ABV7FSE1_9ALTE